MYSSKGFDYKYKKFVGYEICNKLIFTSGKSGRNTNTISKKGTPKSNMNMTPTSEILGFGFYPHKETCDILSENLVSHRLQAYLSINEGGVLRYINKVKSRHDIGLPTNCGYHHCGEKQVLILELCLFNLILHY